MEKKVDFYANYIHITNIDKFNISFYQYSCSQNLK